MRDVWILLRLRTRQSWNILLHGKEMQRRTSSLGALLIGICICLVSILGITGVTWLLIEVIASAFRKMSYVNITVVCVLIGLSIFISSSLRDVGAALLRILEARDTSSILVTRLSVGHYLFGKLTERSVWQLLNDIGWGIPVIGWLLARYGTACIPVLLAYGICYVVGHFFRIWLTLTMLHWKLQGNRLLPWSLGMFLLQGCKWIAFVTVCLLIGERLELGVFSEWARTLHKNERFIGFINFLGNTASAGEDPFIVVLILGIICILLWSCMKSLQRMVNYYSKGSLFELINNVRRPASNLSVKRPLEGKVLKLPLLPSSILWFLAKDIAQLRRTRSLETWIMIVVVLFGIGTSIFTFYFVDRGVDVEFSGYYMTTSFGVLGTMSTVFVLLNRFGIDNEGPHLLLLRSAPIGVKDIVWSKWILLCAIALPFTIITFFIPMILYPVSWWEWVPVWISVTLVFSSLGICSTAIYPNLYYESMLDLPSSKARWFFNGVGAVYVTILSFIWTTLPTIVTPWVVLVFSLPTAIVLLRAAMTGLEREEFRRHVSLESLIR